MLVSWERVTREQVTGVLKITNFFTTNDTL